MSEPAKLLTPDNLQHGIHSMVYEICRAVREEKKLEDSILGYSQQSATEIACVAARAGIVGNGNSGTKGVGRRSWLDPEPANDRSWYHDWKQTLSGELLRIHEAIADDGAGFELSEYPFGDRVFKLSLEQRLALRLKDHKTLHNWAKHVALKDSQPFLDGAQYFGDQYLLELGRSFQNYH